MLNLDLLGLVFLFFNVCQIIYKQNITSFGGKSRGKEGVDRGCIFNSV